MRGLILTFSVTLFALVATGAGGETPVDSDQQCSMFKRIFSYDKHLRESDKIVVLVVGQTADGADVEAVVSAFRDKKMYPAPVTVSGLTSDLTATLSQQSTVVYVMAGVDYAAVEAFAANHGFLTISGTPTLVESGRVSVSVDLENNRPQVVVNMARLTIEGHELSSELLKLARIIR
jgi:hypothetical protein